MQPKTQQRPVMDVTARRPVARSSTTSPAEALAVHAPPAPETHGAVPESAGPATAPQAPVQETPPHREQPAEKPVPATPQPSGSQAPAPVGAIICTILVMAGLSAVAIAIYVSQK